MSCRGDYATLLVGVLIGSSKQARFNSELANLKGPLHASSSARNRGPRCSGIGAGTDLPCPRDVALHVRSRDPQALGLTLVTTGQRDGQVARVVRLRRVNAQ